MIRKWWNKLTWLQQESIIKFIALIVTIIVMTVDVKLIHYSHEDIALAITLLWMIFMIVL